MNNNNNNNDILFFKIWSNLYLRKKILNDCLFFRNHSKVLQLTLNKIENHKFKNYLTNLEIKENIPYGFDYPPYLETIKVLGNVESQLPNTIKNLTTKSLKNKFGQMLLPYDSKLESLNLLLGFNTIKEIYYIPSHLTTLIWDNSNYDRYYNYNDEQLDEIKIKLPTTLINLNIVNLNKNIQLPNGLKNLKVTNYIRLVNFSKEIYESLISLSLSKRCKCDEESNFLDNLKLFKNLNSLTISLCFDPNYKINCFPNSLKKLKFNNFNSNKSISKGVLPSSLEYLILSINYNSNCIFIPKNVKSLKFSDLTIFNNNDNSNNSNDNQYPDSITSLTFGKSFNYKCSLPLNLPLNLEILDLSNSKYCQKVYKGDAISKLQYLKVLKFSNDFSSQIPENYLPNSIEILQFGSNYDYQLPLKLPTSLKCLIIPECLKFNILRYKENNNFKVQIYK